MCHAFLFCSDSDLFLGLKFTGAGAPCLGYDKVSAIVMISVSRC